MALTTLGDPAITRLRLWGTLWSVQHLFIWDLFHAPAGRIQRFDNVEKPAHKAQPLFRAAGHFVGHGEALAGR